MNYQTYGQVRTRVSQELDLGNETFIGSDEMVGFCNEALAEAEAEIHKINEDYFLKKATLTLVANQQLYSLPADIYANKIRKVVYVNGAIIYPVRKMKRSEVQFYEAAVTDYFGAGLTSYRYRYLILNPSATTGMQMELHPASTEAGAFLQIWYLRTVQTIPLVSTGSQGASDATLIDVPEFYNFVLHYMKCKCLEKEGDPRFDAAVMALEHQRKMMVDTLTQMIPDDDDTIVPDFSFYGDME